MDCATVAGHLVGYHVGTVSEEERDAVEGHLVSCSACLRTYMALKRVADRAERPRPEVRARLRAEVARAFPPRKQRWTSRTGAVLGRRIPLYQSVALAAVAAAIALVAPGLGRRALQAGAHHDKPAIDTSRPSAASLHIY